MEKINGKEGGEEEWSRMDLCSPPFFMRIRSHKQKSREDERACR
jgi:hypothetical protein